MQNPLVTFPGGSASLLLFFNYYRVRECFVVQLIEVIVSLPVLFAWVYCGAWLQESILDVTDGSKALLRPQKLLHADIHPSASKLLTAF
jgi:hypothetical protein